jgi:hypothetical protein
MFNHATRCLVFVHPFVSLCLCICPLFGNRALSEAPTATLKRVELFPAGQCVFEYESTHVGSMELELPIGQRELDDFLKSVVLKGFDSMRVEYRADIGRDDVKEQLAGLSAKETRAELLQELKGLLVRVEGAEQTKEGRIVAIELQTDLEHSVGRNEVLDHEVLTLNTERGLEQIPLSAETNVTILDPIVKEKFEQRLNRFRKLEPERSNIILKLTKEKAGVGSIAYQTESAPWKCSYRLSEIDGQYRLMVAALIDNTTGFDWNEIELVLIMDQPLGFHSPVAKIRKPIRDTLEAELPFSLAPPSLAAGARLASDPEFAWSSPQEYDESDPFAPRAQSYGMGGMGGMGMGGMGGMSGMIGPVNPTNETARGANTNAAATRKGGNADLHVKLGLSFAVDNLSKEIYGRRMHIRIPNVTVPNGKSQTVFLPEIPHTIRALDVYAPSVHQRHPLAAFEITLKKGYQLMSGPGTVWNAHGYAGDIMIPRLVSDTPQMIAYAVDSEIEVRQETLKPIQRPSQWKEGQDERGATTIAEETLLERVVQYQLINGGALNKTVIVMHVEKEPAWKVLGAEDALNRFETLAKAEATTKFEVRESQLGEKLWERTMALDALQRLQKRDGLPESVVTLVRKWIANQERALELDRKLFSLKEVLDKTNNEMAAVKAERERLR